MAWEMVEANELTRELEAVREQRVMEFFKMFFMQEKRADEIQSGIMLVGAAVSYLLIRSGHIEVYGGMGLVTDADWKRIQSAIDAVVRGLAQSG